MRYLTIEMIKKQVVIDTEFLEDDVLLESIGDTAEEYVEQLVNSPLDDIAAQNGGDLPKPLYHAMLVFCDYLYSTARGSSGTENPIPVCIEHMVKLYRNFE